MPRIPFKLAMFPRRGPVPKVEVLSLNELADK